MKENKYLKFHKSQIVIFDTSGNKVASFPVSKIGVFQISLKNKTITVNGHEITHQIEELEKPPQIEIETDASISNSFFCGNNTIKLAVEYKDISENNQIIKKLYDSNSCFFSDRKTDKAAKGDLMKTNFNIHFNSLTVTTEQDGQTIVDFKYDFENLVIDGVVIYGAVAI